MILKLYNKKILIDWWTKNTIMLYSKNSVHFFKTKFISSLSFKHKYVVYIQKIIYLYILSMLNLIL